MSESLPLRDRYLALIDEIVNNTLKGKISSVDQIYQMLLNWRKNYRILPPSPCVLAVWVLLT